MNMFFIVGAMKSGTTSLYRHLACHPDIFASPDKEPKFFSNPTPSADDWEQYRALFSEHTSEKWAFEASVHYSKHPRVPGVPARIHDFAPDSRLIYCLRNPVVRTVSMYLHNLTGGWEKRDFEDAVFNDPDRYIAPSCYFMQLEQFLKFFPPDRVHFVIFEEFIKNPENGIRDVFQFLDVDSDFCPPTLHERFNETHLKTMSLPTIRRLEHNSLYQRLPWRLRNYLRTKFRVSPTDKNDLLTDDVYQRIWNLVNEDVAKLTNHLGRTIPAWESQAPPNTFSTAQKESPTTIS